MEKYNRYRMDENNPCLEESSLSLSCLEKNDYDREKCTLYFLNYKECKKFWSKIKRARRLAGITPNMPSAEERAKIYEKRKLDPKVIQVL